MNRLDDIDAVLFDIGGTLVVESPPTTPLSQLHAEVLPGVVQTLNELAEHHRIAAVTNTASMREADVRRLLEPVGLNALLEMVVTSVDVGAAKPDPAPLNEALRRLGVAAEKSVYVGDALGDQIAAASAGMHFV